MSHYNATYVSIGHFSIFEHRSHWFLSKGIILSFYSKYIAERTGKHMMETDKGFAIYSYPDKETVYIEDIYTDHKYRKSNEAALLADQIVIAAKERGCTKLIGSVVPSTNGSTDSLRILLAYGMKLDSSANNFILFSKDIR